MTDTTRWFDIEPCFVFHTINAYQVGAEITYDVVRYDELWVDRSTDQFPVAVPYRYRIDLDAGTVTEGALDDRPAEFPMIDRRLTGRRTSTSWAVSFDGDFSAPPHRHCSSTAPTAHPVVTPPIRCPTPK